MKVKFILLLIIFMSATIFSQENIEHKFTMLHEVKTTPVKNQGRTGTCWSFATNSFLENEILRISNKKIDISEMFTVRHKLIPMAEKIATKISRNSPMAIAKAVKAINANFTHGVNGFEVEKEEEEGGAEEKKDKKDEGSYFGRLVA